MTLRKNHIRVKISPKLKILVAKIFTSLSMVNLPTKFDILWYRINLKGPKLKVIEEKEENQLKNARKKILLEPPSLNMKTTTLIGELRALSLQWGPESNQQQLIWDLSTTQVTETNLKEKVLDLLLLSLINQCNCFFYFRSQNIRKSSIPFSTTAQKEYCSKKMMGSNNFKPKNETVDIGLSFKAKT